MVNFSFLRAVVARSPNNITAHLPGGRRDRGSVSAGVHPNQPRDHTPPLRSPACPESEAAAARLGVGTAPERFRTPVPRDRARQELGSSAAGTIRRRGITSTGETTKQRKTIFPQMKCRGSHALHDMVGHPFWGHCATSGRSGPYLKEGMKVIAECALQTVVRDLLGRSGEIARQGRG